MYMLYIEAYIQYASFKKQFHLKTNFRIHLYMFQEASIFYIHTHYTVYNACIVCVQLEDHRQDDVFQLQTDINSLRLG